MTVVWDQVDSSGFGYVTFDPRGCNVDCYSPTTIRVPVIQSNGTIVGPQSICVKSYARYELPQWPTTDIQWEIIGNDSNNLAEIILTDQRNEVIVYPYVPDTLILKATYINTLTGCSGVATFVITVEPRVEIMGDTQFCVGSVTWFTTGSGQPAEWTLFDADENLIATQSGTHQFQYQFNTPGNYVLSTSGSVMCEGEQKTITVYPQPDSVQATSILGNRIICPTQPYTYTISNADPNFTYTWSVQNGSFVGSNQGTSVIVSYQASGPYSLSVVKQSISPIVCNSSPTVLSIELQTVPVTVMSENNVSSVCANTYQDFFAYQTGTSQLYTQGEVYTWSLSDTGMGSVTSGQGTPSASILWYNVDTPTVVNVILTIQKCTLPPQVFSYTVTVVPIPLIEITGPTEVCSGASFQLQVASLNGVALDPMSIVTWNGSGSPIQGGLTHTFNFLNNGSSNIGRTITATIETPNGCTVSTNVAVFNVTLLPGPPASLSIFSGGNSFCDENDINTLLEIGTSIAGLNITWYQDNVILNPQPIPNTQLLVTSSLGFGSYKFRVVDSNGCVSFSNTVQIRQDCNETAECILDPMPVLTNLSFNDCGIVYLNGSTTVPPIGESYKIVGPNFNQNDYTASSFVAEAGEYHIDYKALYQCQNPPFNMVNLRDYKKVTVPYVPKFSYQKICNQNTNFTLTFFDETNFFAPVYNRSVIYFIRESHLPSSSNVLVTGTSISNLGSGSYIITQVVQGVLDGVLQAPCSYELEIELQTMSDGIFPFVSNVIKCYNTSVEFEVFESLPSDTFSWTFDENAQSTLRVPQRVFTTSGLHTVHVVVTSAMGCSRALTLDVFIPEKCFNGDVAVQPNPPSVCDGQGVTLTYQPAAGSPDLCAVDTYVWMNGLQAVTPAVNAPQLVVTEPGSYWLKLFSQNLCEYATPSRISPVFKPLPTLHLSAAATACSGETYEVKASTNATAISWYLNGILQPVLSNVMQPSFYDLPTGTNIIEAVSTLNGCSTSSSLTVEVMPAPTDLEIYPPQLESCSPYRYRLTAHTSTPNAHFMWSDGQTGSTIYVGAGGPYRVTATIGGCSVSAQIDVPKDPAVYSWIFPSGCYDACKENLGTLIGPRVLLPYWDWSFNNQIELQGHDSFPTPFDVNQTGEYTFTLDTGGCALTTEPLYFKELECDKCKIERIVPVKIIKNESKFCSFTIELQITSADDFFAVLSSMGGDVIVNPSAFTVFAGTHTYLFTVIPTGAYTGGVYSFEIEGINKDGKPCYSKFNLDLPPCESEEFMRNVSSTERLDVLTPYEVQLYPNPTQTQVTLRYQGIEGAVQLYVYDLTGRLMDTATIENGSGLLELPTAAYPEGMYLVVLRQSGKLLSQHKLIKN
ncbi:T9SS type A sorting domain-containing protein [Flavobacterium sp.]|uniref:T9SS type A sorting domain-containing protein n=1 Tax=Flavobacterium sp. TaxID=239 RepID=UPI002FDA3798